MANNLETSNRVNPAGRLARRPGKGWTPERRARQAEKIRLSQPWRHATGPRTEAGKARVAKNPLRHGYRSRAWILKARRIRNAIRICARTVLLARMLQQLEARAIRRRGLRVEGAHKPRNAAWSEGGLPRGSGVSREGGIP